ncbi:MAG: sortase [Aeromicrobium sp.]
MNRTIRIVILTAAFLAALWGIESNGGNDAPPSVSVHVPPTAKVVHQDRSVGKPTRLAIPAIGVNQRLRGVGLKPGGAMETPEFGQAGWYDLGPRPGARGPAVIVAHVHGPAGNDVFARLHELRSGDRVTVKRTDGVSTFVVGSIEQARKDALPYERIWSNGNRPVLRLITCGGTPDPVTHMYPDNTIVYAELAR